MKKFYITTSIAYTNAPPHLGFALELVQADVFARYQRSQKKDVFFLTGTDEHGIKVARKAKNENKSPQEFCDEISGKYKELINKLSISIDDFIRTSDQKRHWPGVYEMWRKMELQNDIYEKKYEGLYCIGCEAFVMPKDLINGKCPYHQLEPEKIQERNYFFRLSKYSKEIEKVIKSNKLEIAPFSRRKEVLAFLKNGLKDISISRSKEKVSWGIPVSGDSDQIIYVWVDALTNYVSAIGYGRNSDDFKNYWPADIQFVGKDISKFHALIWPGMLMSAGLDLPRKIFIHGFLTVNNQKMSKSLGNTVDPLELIEKYGTDSFRYYFLREIPSTEDGDFTCEKFIERYNSDLASGLGNLIARTITLAENISGIEFLEISPEIEKEIKITEKTVNQFTEELKFNFALSEIWKLIKFSDQYIEINKPWEKEKSASAMSPYAGNREGREKVISNLLAILKSIALMIEPFMPETSEKIISQINSKKSKPLFKRIII